MTGPAYAPLTKAELVDLFSDLLIRIESGDSWEGYVNWIMPDETADPSVEAMVHARYRVGNANGSQGGMRVIGAVT